MDPQTLNGKPFGPIRYKELVKENYLIAKNTHITYDEVLRMTPLERGYILEFLVDEAKRKEQEIEAQRRELELKRNGGK